MNYRDETLLNMIDKLTERIEQLEYNNKQIDTSDEEPCKKWAREFLKDKSYIDNGNGSFTLY